MRVQAGTAARWLVLPANGRFRACGVMENLVRCLLAATAVVVTALFVAACAASTGHPAVSAAPLPPDPHTAAALLKIATVFNHDYDTGNYGPVYARWDARSQAIITRADYIARHMACPGGSPALSQGTAMNGPVGWVGLAVSLLLVAVAAG